MALNSFDRKFWKNFIKEVPSTPGVYSYIDQTGIVIYVGKAKNLRRRLQQYRNAKRFKKHHKMRSILLSANKLLFETCATDLDALLLENQKIRDLKPKFNVSGAFSFLYPAIALLYNERRLTVVYTTSPDLFQDFKCFGSYRSRHICREAFFAIKELLEFVGHLEPRKSMHAIPKVKFSHASAFRQIDSVWHSRLSDFLNGASKIFLDELVVALLEKPAARKRAEEVQKYIDSLICFYKFEALKLKHVRERLELQTEFVPQNLRDEYHLKAKFHCVAQNVLQNF